MDLRTSSNRPAIMETEKIKFNIDGLIASHNSSIILCNFLNDLYLIITMSSIISNSVFLN